MRFVDFEAATDGPVVVDENGVPRTYSTTYAGGTVSVEEIILCEACVRAAAEELALEPRRMEEMANRLRAAEARADRAEARAQALRVAAIEWGADPDQKARADQGTRKSTATRSPETRQAAMAMLDRGVSQVQVAKRFGVSAQTIKNWREKARQEDRESEREEVPA